ncbi:MFS transporter [Gordonia pseudamarae]|uniref:MFS transporter n=1 Tax=Gordonia pseudamarae TaxID=2831662 RepID=A0ABX6IGT4_9ACTN|nr:MULTISPECIES: MFS transporter [Gordonia]MBD0023392.1 MFS transporter [Gordonia sp. (in: high G+C Gram-positive bacteria)]QHN25574.1 MFS transporter [Gordonia pseudamarae]QHN34505.1 MFS transporter [Gordonia pseudamarae]
MRSIPRGIWVLLSANVVIALGYGLIAPALPSFARSFDVGITAASAVVSAFAVMRLIFAPGAGRLIAVVGERRVYLVGLLIVAISTLACAFAQNYWQLLVFRGLGGIGSTMFTVSAMGLLIRMAPDDIRGRVSGYFSAGFLIGNITGPLIGSALVGFGLRMPFVVYAIALIIASIVVATQLRADGDTPGSGQPTGGVAVSLAAAWGNRAYRAVLVSNFANGWASFGVRVAVVPLFVVDGLGEDAALAGVVLAAYAAGNVMAIMTAGRLSDAHGRRTVILPGLVVVSVATAAMGFTSSIVVTVAVSAVAGLGSGLFVPTQQATLADVLGNRVRGGSALAAFSMASDLGAVSGPIVVGLIASTAGFTTAFAVTGGVTAIALLMWLFAPETAPARVAESTPGRAGDMP